ncbi:MAG TPA: protease pro-enzyme activation domain-containing protein, partial [Solirubrobacteraceae bacterium]|nr:protease pro-enzyme activation domain-containing protein [Solirubrobacteraceae bacterium]
MHGARRRFAVAAVAAAIAACAGVLGAQASGASSPPLLGRLLQGTVPKLVALAHDLGTVSLTKQISFDLPLALPDVAGLDAYVADEYTPGTSDYRRFLTPAEFGARFGAPASEVDKVLSALHLLGLNAVVPGVNRLYVQATGTVALVDRIFDVALSDFQLGSRRFFANLGDIRLPAVLQGLVTGVVGLDDSNPPTPQLAPATGAARQHPALVAPAKDGGAAPCLSATLGLGYTAPDLAQAYDFNGLYAKGFHGEGMSAALVEFDDFHDSNARQMESCYGITTPITRVMVHGGPGGPPGTAEAEDMADISTLLPLAPRLAHLYVYEAPITTGATVMNQGASEVDLYDAFVTQDKAQVLSASWGSCEELQNQAYDDLFGTVAEEAAAQGQQIFDAAGDSGAVDCRGTVPPTLGSISVEQEAAVPWITGVGGTDLSVESTIAALRVHHEVPWNDAGAGGGGQSVTYPMPSWQAAYMAATNDHPAGESGACGAAAGQLCRMVPDIALDADPEAGGLLDQAPLPPDFFPTDVGSPGLDTYCDTPNCSFLSQLTGLPLPIGGQPPAGAGGWYPIGGTSLATPMAAAAAILWDQEAKAAGLGTIGFLNPALYRVASNPQEYAADFHDITTGSNSDQFDAADCASGCNPQHLYAAGRGYDMATGLGSIDAAHLGADLVASAGQAEMTPDTATMYGYPKGPRTTQTVSVTTGYANGTYTAKSSAKWLQVATRGRAPGTLRWHVNPAKLRRGTYRGHITVRVNGEAAAVLAVTYSVTPKAKISLSAPGLTFTERAIDAKGNTTTATCGATVWNDELKSTLNGSGDASAVDASTRQTLKIANSGPRGSVLHYEALFTTQTGAWLSQDLNPASNPNGFQTTAQQPLVQTEGAVAAHGAPALLPMASLANSNAVGGYPPMNQGTYSGVIQIRDRADPAIVKSVPVRM